MALAAQPNDDRAKFPAPNNFKSRADGAKTWLMMLEEWLDTPGMPQNLTDRNKVRMALFKIEGEANQWKNSRLAKYKTITAAHPNGEWPSWVEFKTDFLAQWGESNEAAKALRQLKNYEYRRHTKTPLGQILTTVDTLIQEAGIGDEEQKKSFLRQAIPPNYALMLAISRPATYADSVNVIQQFEVELGRNTFSSQPTRMSMSDPFAMDTSLDRLAINSTLKGKGSAKDVQCFKCHRKGHFAKDCFAKTTAEGVAINRAGGSGQNRSTNRPSHQNKGWQGRGKGKGKGRFKKRYIRGAEVEEEEYDEEQEQDTSNTEYDDMRKTLALMNEDRKKEFYMALKQDFQ